MMKSLITLLVVFGLSMATVFGDFLIKEASLQKNFVGWKLLLAGAAVWALTALGWFFVMRREEFSILGALYAITMVISLFLLGAFFYNEHITSLEMIGLGFGIVSIILLFRFTS